MTDENQQDHWKSLASDLGADAPADLPEPPKPLELTPTRRAGDVAPQHQEQPRPKHWSELAGELGLPPLENDDEEELPVEAVEELAPAGADADVSSLENALPVETSEDYEVEQWSEGEAWSESAEPPLEELFTGDALQPQPPAHQLPSRGDLPPVLPGFAWTEDEDETPEPPRESRREAPAARRRPPAPAAPPRYRPEPSEEPDTWGLNEEPPEARFEAAPAGEQEEGEDGERPRRRRRRRRGRRRDEAGEGETRERESADEVEDDDLGFVPPSSLDDELEVEPGADEEDSERGVRRRRGRRRGRRRESSESTADVEAIEELEPLEPEMDDVVIDDDDDDDHDERGEGGEGARHRKIPTWEEAISFIVDANLASRTKNPQRGRGGGGGGARRGGGGRRR